jgi:hypothetical protein
MIRALLISMIALGIAAAQESGQVEFRVTRFDPGDQVSPVFKVGPAASGGEEVEVPLTYIGGPHKATLRDRRFLDFWRGDAEKPEISVSIAENERADLLLLFIQMENRFEVIKVNTPLSRMRGGDRYLVNATTQRLAVKMGAAEPVVIEPGKAALLRVPVGEEVISVSVRIGVEKEGDWDLASTEIWPIDPRFRRYLFAYISTRNRQLTFHGVSERLVSTQGNKE